MHFVVHKLPRLTVVNDHNRFFPPSFLFHQEWHLNIPAVLEHFIRHTNGHLLINQTADSAMPAAVDVHHSHHDHHVVSLPLLPASELGILSDTDILRIFNKQKGRSVR
jgi:hypothetical protein